MDLVRSVHGKPVAGISVGPRGECAHWGSPLDVVAIRFKCCGEYYACHACHEALAGHPSIRWERGDREARAVLCGACGTELTVREYLNCDDGCPRCGARFNPGCRAHRRLYFEADVCEG